MKRYRYCVVQGVPEDKRLTFFATMGWFFAAKEVRRELGGYPVGFEDDFVWVQAFDGRGKVAGFASLKPPAKGVAWLQDAYVLPEHRHQGIYRELTDRRIEEARRLGATTVCAMVRAPLLPFHQAQGFTVLQQRGQWYRIGLELAPAPQAAGTPRPRARAARAAKEAPHGSV